MVNTKYHSRGGSVIKSYIKAIDKAVAIAKENKVEYINIANEITETLYEITNQSQQKIVGINNRIKTEYSLKEKLIRKKIYKQTLNPKEMLTYIGDIIGVLIECEFVTDESSVYEAIKNDFYQTEDDFSQSKTNKAIWLNLKENQPQILKNGTETYKIDGLYKKKDFTYKFELQIKSMVKVFWSEVEHSIVYKNNYYMQDDAYVVKTLSAIKRNLFGLDDMLHIINAHTSTINSSSLLSNLTLNERLVKQLISETFNDKIMKSIRIKINIKNTRDLACKFIIREDSKLPEEEKNKNFYNLIERFKTLQKLDTLDYVKKEDLVFNGQNKKAKEVLLKMIDEDFEWDLYFQILNNIYPEQNLRYFINETIYMLSELMNIQDIEEKEQNKRLIEYIKQGIS